MRKILIVLLAAALTVLTAGCGTSGDMSLSAYRESISELHDGVAWDLAETLEELSGLDFGDFYDLPGLREAFRAAGDIFAAAGDTAGSLRPPREAEDLHAGLLDFYSEGAEGMRDKQNALGFFEAVLPMLRDVENLALFGIPESAGVEEIKAAAMEDTKTMNGYLKELERMDPPPELHPYREKLEDLFRSIDVAAAEVDREVVPEDLDSLARFREWFAAALGESQALWMEAMSYLGGSGGSIDSYIERGKELAERIYEL